MTTVVDITGFGAIFSGLERQFNDIDYIEPLQWFQEVEAETEREAFASQTSPGGDAWKPLKPATVKRKGHSTILVEHGALKESLVSIGGPNNINEVSARGSLYGTSDEKSIYHTFGTDRLPIRDHVGTNEESVDKLADRIADHAVDNLK